MCFYPVVQYLPIREAGARGEIGDGYRKGETLDFIPSAKNNHNKFQAGEWFDLF